LDTTAYGYYPHGYYDDYAYYDYPYSYDDSYFDNGSFGTPACAHPARLAQATLFKFAADTSLRAIAAYPDTLSINDRRPQRCPH
jgi:hypothetical protein